MTGNSSLTVETGPADDGRTLTGQLPRNLSVSPGSDLMLEVNGQAAGGWVFRWANPAGGDHVADLQALVNGGELTFFSLNGGFSDLTADASYTYVTVVPEPSALVLTAAAGLLIGVRRRSKK